MARSETTAARITGALRAILPQSDLARVAIVACAGILGPLAMVAILVVTDSFAGVVALAILGAVSCAATFLALRAVLLPVLSVTQRLEQFQSDDLRGALPVAAGDDAGRLIGLVDALVASVRQELHMSRTAADTDPLTGLLNRRGFDRHRMPDQGGSIIFVDLDHFKQINDSLGHDAGDVVLCATADLLRAALREGELVARFGGEEFVVWLPEIGLDAATAVAERVRRRAEGNLTTDLGGVTISAGVATLGQGGSFSDALTRADRAVYDAKRAGRNCVRVAAAMHRVEPVVTAAE
ncbi:MAG: GGDEF domain-containing protein [Pseudomonadota bacterium]